MTKLTKLTMAAVVGGLAMSITGCSDRETVYAATEKPKLPARAKWLQAPEVTTHVGTAERELPKANGDMRVEGEKPWNSYFLVANRIVMAPNSVLRFTCDAINSRPNLFLVAQKIVSEDPQRPGRITWSCPPRSTPGELGTADAGADMASGPEGATGGPGATGKTGVAGEAGRQAPTLTIITAEINNPLTIDLIGQDGGPGGKGQTGGRGGGGGRGNPASQDAFNCRRGAGNGAPGGVGGNGGPGGAGGAGGRGGTFILITPDDAIPLATRLVKVNQGGGNSGSPGPGGDSGVGGPGGPGGQEARPWCSGNGSNGPVGPNGNTGPVGVVGQRGADGDYFVGSLGLEALDKLTQTSRPAPGFWSRLLQ